ncbi:MAG TPA: ABC transporter permease [Firmicutes bacterium]|jgi:peptide/nickel transport system permease protein|nr:ABC transporter permease [Bacillota bacterium]
MDTRKWGIVIIGLVFALTILGYFYTPYDPNEVSVMERFAPPGQSHLLGTDHFGRDVFSRILVGSRVSLAVGVGAVALGSLLGVTLGLWAGFRGGLVEELFMRISTALQAFPSILLALLFATIWQPGVPVILWAVAIGNIPNFLRLTRSQVLSIKKRSYVEAARALGATDARIVVRHVIPNVVDSLLVQFTVSLAGAILVEASLSYLGVGIQPPTPSWGRMLREAQGYAGLAPWVLLAPGLFIAVTVIGFNLLGDTWIFRRDGVFKRE